MNEQWILQKYVVLINGKRPTKRAPDWRVRAAFSGIFLASAES
jgi:hypothetical protein